MKQPQLGQKISSYRNEKGYTQEKLSELTNINIRTIQRIESGDVEPRLNTVKIIAESLGVDFEDLNDTNSVLDFEKTGILKKAWISGIVMILCNILIIILIMLRDLYSVRDGVYHIIIPVLVCSTICFVLFNRGIVYLGRILQNDYLKITGIVSMILIFFINLNQFGMFYFESHTTHILSRIFAMIIAVNGIFLGIGFLFLKNILNDLPFITGILLILNSMFYLIPIDFVNFLGVVISTPIWLPQILIFYKLEKGKFN